MSTLSQTNTNYENNKSNIVSYTYNLVNIMPNPLYNNYINKDYDNELYITSDLDGITNTSYLKFSKNNIANKISDDMYIPSIGELGIVVENIHKINTKISYLNNKISIANQTQLSYASYFSYISYNTIIPSSSLYSSQNIKHTYYTVENNINNVWCVNTANGEISYKPTSMEFNVIPFYTYNTHVI